MRNCVSQFPYFAGSVFGKSITFPLGASPVRADPIKRCLARVLNVRLTCCVIVQPFMHDVGRHPAEPGCHRDGLQRSDRTQLLGSTPEGGVSLRPVMHEEHRSLCPPTSN